MFQLVLVSAVGFVSFKTRVTAFQANLLTRFDNEHFTCVRSCFFLQDEDGNPYNHPMLLSRRMRNTGTCCSLRNSMPIRLRTMNLIRNPMPITRQLRRLIARCTAKRESPERCTAISHNWQRDARQLRRLIARCTAEMREPSVGCENQALTEMILMHVWCLNVVIWNGY
jgi:hypothetical protein